MRKIPIKPFVAACLAAVIAFAIHVPAYAAEAPASEATPLEAYNAFNDRVAQAKKQYVSTRSCEWETIGAFYDDWVALRDMRGFMSDDELVLYTDWILSSAALNTYEIRVREILSHVYSSEKEFEEACEGVDFLKDGITTESVLVANDRSSYAVFTNLLSTARIAIQQSGSWDGDVSRLEAPPAAGPSGTADETNATPSEPAMATPSKKPSQSAIDLGNRKLGKDTLKSKLDKLFMAITGGGANLMAVNEDANGNAPTTGNELPKTGGPGTYAIYACGAMLLLSAGVMVIHTKKRDGAE